MTRTRGAQIFVLGSLVWGTLAFGATYEWASRPLAILAIIAAVFCFAAGRRSQGPGKLLGLMMMLLLLAIGAQLVPLSQSTLSDLSPARHQLLQQLYIGYRFNPTSHHPLSIDPPLTWWALVFCAVSFAWVVGLSKLLTITGVKWLATGLTLLGVAIGLIGIAQNALYDGRVYWFWTPMSSNAAPFGPFINKNHFAGWMLMVLPVTFGLFGSGVRRAMIGVPPTWRDRVVWLSSRSASRLLLITAGATVMALALILTMSRSGIASLSLALILFAGFGLRSAGGRVRRLLVALTPLVVAAGMFIWVGSDTIADRFGALGSGDLALRQAAWSDARDIGASFPMAGIGLNTYGTATLVLQKRLTEFHFDQAHSDYLQLWVEGGILLIIPALGLAIAFLARIVRRVREQAGADPLRTGAVVGMIAILLQETVDFSLQMPGNLLLFATLCAIAIHPARQRDAPGR